MHCDGCAAGLTSELRRLGGVATAEVSLTNKSAVVSFDSNRVAMAGLLKAVSEAGFEGKTR
jgi:copper chaperone